MKTKILEDFQICISVPLNFYFHTFLWCLKNLYEGLKGLHTAFWGTTKKNEKNFQVNFFLVVQNQDRKGQKPCSKWQEKRNIVWTPTPQLQMGVMEISKYWIMGNIHSKVILVPQKILNKTSYFWLNASKILSKCIPELARDTFSFTFSWLLFQW